jgi:hypothetical protein
LRDFVYVSIYNKATGECYRVSERVPVGAKAILKPVKTEHTLVLYGYDKKVMKKQTHPFNIIVTT